MARISTNKADQQQAIAGLAPKEVQSILSEPNNKCTSKPNVLTTPSNRSEGRDLAAREIGSALETERLKQQAAKLSLNKPQKALETGSSNRNPGNSERSEDSSDEKSLHWGLIRDESLDDIWKPFEEVSDLKKKQTQAAASDAIAEQTTPNEVSANQSVSRSYKGSTSIRIATPTSLSTPQPTKSASQIVPKLIFGSVVAIVMGMIGIQVVSLQRLSTHSSQQMPASEKASAVGETVVPGARGSQKENPDASAIHPVAIPYYKTEAECIHHRKQWKDDKCLDAEHSPLY